MKRDRVSLTESVLFCDGLLGIISATRIKWLIDRFSFRIDILECIYLCERRAKEFKVPKYFVNTFCSVLDREVRGSKHRGKYLVEANLHLAIKLQLELNIQAILFKSPQF